MDNKIIKEDIQKMLLQLNLDDLKGKKVLLTGASGLIGTYLAYSIAIANQSYSHIDKIELALVIYHELPEQLKEIEQESWSKIYRGDLTDHVFCMSLPKSDFILHAAGYGQPGKFMENKIKTIQLNTTCTSILLEKLNTNGKFLFVSTSEVYSNSPNIPYKENDHGTTMPEHPRSCYIEGKRCGEALCNAYADEEGRIKIARVSLAYGPGIRKGDKRVLYSFIQKGLQEGKIAMLDAGQAKRMYCYISDTIEILWNILLKGKDITYNVGGESSTTILNLAQLIAEVLGVEVSYPSINSGIDGAPDDVYTDISKIKKEFNKTNFITLNDGIHRTIQWYKENL